MVILSILFIALAGLFKAVADKLTHHFDKSIFNSSNLKREWWDPSISWQHVGFLPYTKYRPDAWHLANSGMIVCFCIAVVLHRPVLWFGFELILAGLLFISVFNLFYNKLLMK